MAARVLIDGEALARYDIHPKAIEKLNALIDEKQRRALPDERQVRLSLNSLMLETKCLVQMQEVQRHRSNNEVWLSEPFYSGPEGYKMCLGVYANGQSEVRGSYESVFLQLLEGEFDGYIRWPFKGTATVKLLDQSSQSWLSRDIERSFSFTFYQPVRSYQRSSMQNRASVPDFARLVIQDYCPYEVDDCSCYEVSVQVEH